MEDVQRLSALKILVDHGEAISQIAALDINALEQRVEMIQSKVDREVIPSSVISADSQTIKVAVFGAFLNAKLSQDYVMPKSIELACSDTSLGHFRECIAELKPDALILEMPLINSESSLLIRELAEESDARAVIVVYRFGSRHDIERLRPTGIMIMRSPSRVDELFELLTAAIGPTQISEKAVLNQPATIEGSEQIPSKLFSEKELVALSIANSDIECECPHQLVELVNNLSAFEAYSADCESKGDKDAQLHAYLHRVTAQVRFKMEEALRKLAIAEGILPPRR
ncbi:MAG: hypothetical protein AAF197_00230 [Pseudomonadota bacterium]